MTNNPSFPSPIPTLADVQEATGAYAEALNAAASLGRVAVAEKKAARATLQGLLAQLGTYVMFVANGDEARPATSGYTLAKIPQPRKLEIRATLRLRMVSAPVN